MFGLNVLAQYVQDRAALLDWVDAAHPRYCVVMDDLSTAQAIRLVAPDTTVIYRQYFPHEAEKHWHQTHTPQAWLDAHRPLALPGIVVHCFNEPHGYEDLRPLARWAADLMALAHDAGIRLCLPNWGVGHPDEARIAAGELDDLFAAFDRFPEHLYGVHEYAVFSMADEQLFRIGRFRHSFDRIAKMKPPIRFPQVVITESGRDIGGGENDGWRAVLAPDQYADFLDGCVALYSRYNVAACLYCYGAGAISDASGQPQWRSFDVQGAGAVLDKLTEINLMTQTPDYGTLQPPGAAVVTGTGGSTLRVRLAPVSGQQIGSLSGGEVLAYYSKAWNGWRKFIWTDGRAGYASAVYLDFAPVPVVEPPVDPHPPITVPLPEWDPSGRVSRGELADWFRAMAALIEHGVIDTTPGA